MRRGTHPTADAEHVVADHCSELAEVEDLERFMEPGAVDGSGTE